MESHTFNSILEGILHLRSDSKNWRHIGGIDLCLNIIVIISQYQRQQQYNYQAQNC